MPNLLTITNDTGSLRIMAASSSLINPVYFPVSKSVSNSYAPQLNETAVLLTQSANLTNNSLSTSASLMTFSLPSTAEKFYFVNDGIIGVQAVGTTVGPKVTMQSANSGDSLFVIKHANSLSSQQFLYKGTKDPLLYPSASAVVAANVTVPNEFHGITLNSTTFGGTFSNALILQSATESQQVTAISGSYWTNTYAGFSSSVQPNSSSFGPLAASASFIKLANGPTDYVSSDVTFATSSLTRYFKLPTNFVNAFDVDAGAWTQVFDYGSSGSLVSGRRYWASFYLLVVSSVAQAGFRLWVSGSRDVWGSTYTVSAATGRAISTSSGSSELIQDASAATLGGTSPFIVFGEFLTTTTANNSGPKVLFRVEPVAGQTSTVKSGSLFMWREIS